MNTNIESPRCPACGGLKEESVSGVDIEDIDDGWFYMHWDCPGCGASGCDAYRVRFVETEYEEGE